MLSQVCFVRSPHVLYMEAACITKMTTPRIGVCIEMNDYGSENNSDVIATQNCSNYHFTRATGGGGGGGLNSVNNLCGPRVRHIHTEATTWIRGHLLLVSQ